MYLCTMPLTQKINIALDGYAGCGKSTTAKQVAAALGYLFIDTGSMYRAFTLFLQRNDIPYTDVAAVTRALPDASIAFRIGPMGQRITTLNGADVEHEIRSIEVSRDVSEVATIAEVRHHLVAQQQAMGRNKGLVMDGRDIGTVVFPDAELKVFMTASLEARVQRRVAELAQLGLPVDEDDIRRNLLHRDEIDTTRVESPLRRAPDARLLDTTYLQIPDQVAQVLAWANELVHPVVR